MFVAVFTPSRLLTLSDTTRRHPFKLFNIHFNIISRVPMSVGGLFVCFWNCLGCHAVCMPVAFPLIGVMFYEVCLPLVSLMLRHHSVNVSFITFTN